MHGTVRYYAGPGGKELFDVLAEHTSDIESLIKDVPGFVSYVLIRSSDGGCSVTVCNDKAGCDESTRRAAQFIRDNAGNIAAPAAMISEGDVLVRM
jgi:hypothetical protein